MTTSPRTPLGVVWRAGLLCSLALLTGKAEAQAAPNPAILGQSFNNIVTYLNVKFPVEYEAKIAEWRQGSWQTEAQSIINVGAFDTKQNDVSTLVRFNAPRSMKGRRFLYEHGRLWIFFPGTSQPLRIPPQEQLIGNADIGSILNIAFEKYYQPDPEGSQIESDGNLRLMLKAIAKTDAPYERIEFVYNLDQQRPTSAKYFGLSGKLLRFATFEQPKTALNKKYFGAIKITANPEATDRYTLITYQRVTKRDLPAFQFTPEYLKNWD